MITINMDKARDIHRAKMRDARKPLFAALDVAYQRATETGADTSDIVAKKQALRDVTVDPALEAAINTDELKVIWPDCLGEYP
jgi:hypothetical protein